MVSKAYEDAIDQLFQDVVIMAEKAKKTVSLSVDAFINVDQTNVPEVRRLDDDIHSMEMMIEKHCIEQIALNAPLATDLRMIFVIMKVITDINRIGRYANNIADLAGRQATDIDFEYPLLAMSEKSISLVSEAIDSLLEKDIEKANMLFEKDDDVDSMWASIFRESLTYMMEEPRNITKGMEIILVARYLERIADHACNIGERVNYLVTGTRRYRVHKEKVLNEF
jgi:phosphate transport system protein